MLTRSRRVLLSWAGLCLVLFAVLAALATQAWAPLGEVDELGRGSAAWADEVPGLHEVLRVVEVAFATLGMMVLTLLLAALLLVRRQTRAALLTVGVMLTVWGATTGFKHLLGRDRPEWQHATGLHGTFSFPSGHATSVTAFAGLLVVLVVVFVRRRAARHWLIGLLSLWVLLIWLDRILLGRHFPSDVVGGSLLGAALVLIGVALFDPTPRGHAAKAEPLVEPFVTEKKLAVVLNPIKVEDADAFRAMVSGMAEEAGWSEPRWRYTTVEDPGRSMAHDAAVEGADLVIVCGGDGTVREVCAELAGTGVPVGVVPAGTGNLLARNLGLPLYQRSAVDVALNGQDRAVDLVKVSGDGLEETHYLVMAGMGFDAAIMEGVNEDIKKKVGWFAYVLSALKALMFPPMRLEVSIDGGEPTRHRARTLVVGNVGHLQGGMPLLPEAEIDDGQLDVVMLHPEYFLSWLPIVFRVLARSKKADATLDRKTGRTVSVRASSDVPRQLDGDSIGSGRELRMECIPGRSLVRVPR